GDRHVAAYLVERDISKFNPKAPPPKTPAFWDIVDAGRAPEEGELADVLDEMGRPSTVTLSEIRAAAVGEFLDWLQDRKNRRVIPAPHGRRRLCARPQRHCRRRPLEDRGETPEGVRQKRLILAR